MKKIICFIKEKRTYFKAVSLILVLALMVQTASIAVTAITESGLSLEEMVSIDDSLETMPSIVGEVESKRDEYTKVYELADGSFYEVISNDPIHKNVDGQWEEPVNNIDIPESVDEVTSYCDELVDSIAEEQNSGGISTFSINRSEENPHVLTNFYVVDSSTASVVQANLLYGSYYLLLKIDDDLLTLPNANQQIIKQNLKIDFNSSFVNAEDSEAGIFVRAITEEWFVDDNGRLNAYRDDDPTDNNPAELRPIKDDNNTFNFLSYQDNILDISSISNANFTGEFDITEICQKWDKKVLDNNGLIVKISGNNSPYAFITSCYLERHYLEIDAYDSDFTYHSIDMGYAGQVLINDLTNTITIQRNEMYYPTGEMSLNLYRYFDFSKTYSDSNPAGIGTHWNYECPLIQEKDDEILWSAFDGRRIMFKPSLEDSTEWHDESNEGYILNISDTARTISSPDGLIYTFGTAGKITRIDDGNGNYINVSYNNETTQDYITIIENNSGLKYQFNYQEKDYVLNGSPVSINTLESIEYRDAQNAIIKIDNTEIKLLYDYTILPNNKIALSKVTYPTSATEPDMIVEYLYDSNGRLTSIIDVDKRKLIINYTKTIKNYEYSIVEEGYIDRTFDHYPSVFSLEEYVLNDEYSENVQGVNEYLLKSLLEIERFNTYHRTFNKQTFNDNVETENIHYTTTFELQYYTNDDKNDYYADYSWVNGERYVTQIVSPENGELLGDNLTFEEDDGSSSGFAVWTGSSANGIAGEFNEKNTRYAHIEGSIHSSRSISQFIDIDGVVGDVFVVGGYSRANAAVPDESLFWGIEVYEAQKLGPINLEKDLLYRLSFDPTMSEKDVQFRLGAFKLNKNIEMICYKIVYSHQSGYADFDDVLLYKSSGNVSFFDAPITENEETNTNLLNTPSDSSSNNSSANYAGNNISTNYTYDPNTGFLTQKSIYDNNNTPSLIDSYSYNAMGALKEVSRAIDSTQNATSASYTYEYDKISSIVHKNMRYNFNYNSYGELDDIVVVADGEDDITLISRDSITNEEDTINTITYSNGKVLGYKCDERGRVTLISDYTSSNELYRYEYDNDGNISLIKDYCSERVVSYSDDLFCVNELVDDGNEGTIGELIYSKKINRNQENSEVVSEESKIFSSDYKKIINTPSYDNETKTTSYLSIIKTGENYQQTAFESQFACDYFGRILESSVSYIPEGSSTMQSIVNESSYYEYLSDPDDPESVVTTNLLESYAVKIEDENSDPNTEPPLFASRYEYDFAGRITYIEYEDNITPEPKDETNSEPEDAFFYEYDNAGQLVKELNFVEKTYTEYTYDNYGNVTQKRIYSGEDSYVYGNKAVSPNSDVSPKIIEFEYNNNYGDVLERYDGRYITSDEYGNPLEYYRYVDGERQKYNLTWDGNRLQSVRVDGEDELYEYKYDDEGRRTQKVYYSNITDNYPDGRELVMKTDYIWDDNKLVGYKIIFGDMGTPVTVETVILYDELDNPSGLKYNTECTTSGENSFELELEDTFWFIKDGQGNVKGLYSEKMDGAISCSYTSDGRLLIELSEEYIKSFNDNLTEIDNTKQVLLTTVICAVSIQSASIISMDASQSTHHSYIMDAETGLYYCQNKYYSPEYGRFINIGNIEEITDDLKNPYNANPYIYNNNDPVNYKGIYCNSSSSSKAVGIQIELSKSLAAFSDAVGIEFIYEPIKDELYAYYYCDANSNLDYTERAMEMAQNTLGNIPFTEFMSLKSLAAGLKINHSVSLSCFSSQNEKEFVWPYSYLGTSRTTPNQKNEYRGYIVNGYGYQTNGLCYYPTSNIGFVNNDMSVNYTKLEVDFPALKTYLAAKQSDIIETTK